MVIKRRFFNIIATSLLFLSYSAQAHDGVAAGNHTSLPDPIHFKGLYVFAFDGIPLGKLGIEADQTSHKYAVTCDVMTTGVLKVFVKHSSHSTVAASGDQDFTYPEQLYESHYQTKNKKKYVKIVTKGGVLTEDTLVPPDNPASRKPVPPQQVKGAADPLSLTLRMREGVWKSLQNHNDHFSINLYDGRRLTEVIFTVMGKKNLRMQSGIIPVIDVDVTRKQLAGFTQSEIDEQNPNEPHAHFYLSDDAKLIPIRAEATLWMGTVSATLVKECKDGESCLLGNAE